MAYVSDPIRVHIDTDIGGDIDDLCALALVLNWPDVEITGITTTMEHGGKRAGFVRYALALVGQSHIQVAAGADLSLGCFGLPAELPSEERYWPVPVPAAPGPIASALELLKRSVELGAVIVGIGPFTNLSRLERRYPGILASAKLCLMGGFIRAVPPGFPAWDHSNDYNIQADVSSAQHVLESATPILVPIEVTVQTALRRAHLPVLSQAGPLSHLIARQAEACALDWDNERCYGLVYDGLPDDIINFQHDGLACAIALGWDRVTIETVPLAITIEDGQLRMRRDAGGRPTRVVTGVERESFNRFWLNTVVKE
jgi:purine nucleosidase